MFQKIQALLKSKKGFTLVELMAVIAIIGVLAAIAVPRFNTATDDAAAAKILADLRTIDSASTAHFAANGVYPADVAELVTENYLAAAPTLPAGWGTNAYTITAATGVTTVVLRGGTANSSTPKATVRGWK